MKGHWLRIAAAVAVLAAAGVVGVSSSTAITAPPNTQYDPACDQFQVASATDPSNPLALPSTPAGGDPLQGAHFFVDGPRHGQAAGAVASLLGDDPTSFADSDSWAAYKALHAAQIASNPKASALAKIADQQETQNISEYAGGGGPDAIASQTQKIMCHNATADPTTDTVPVISTFFIYPFGQFCPTLKQIQAWQATFKGLVNAMAWAIGRMRAVILMEIDSLGASGCLQGKKPKPKPKKPKPHPHTVYASSALDLWLADLRYEAQVFSQLPHAVVYEEAGYSDAQSAQDTAQELWQAGVSQVRGFWTNGTHFAWDTSEIRWAQQIEGDLYRLSKGSYSAHFVVNTAQNGQGPLLNPHPTTQGNENLCNPPGRGLGRMPTGDVNPTFDGHSFKYLDAFLWTGEPGRSHNSNCPNGPWQPAGVFDPRFALELAQNANQQLGPGYPSQTY
jgi:endoglucanase